MGFDDLANFVAAFIPNLEFSVVAHASKFINVKLVPSNILDYL